MRGVIQASIVLFFLSLAAYVACPGPTACKSTANLRTAQGRGSIDSGWHLGGSETADFRSGAPKATNAAARSGIIAYSSVLSDDKAYALCEFVARDWATLNALLVSPGAAKVKDQGERA